MAMKVATCLAGHQGGDCPLLDSPQRQESKQESYDTHESGVGIWVLLSGAGREQQHGLAPHVLAYSASKNQPCQGDAVIAPGSRAVLGVGFEAMQR